MQPDAVPHLPLHLTMRLRPLSLALALALSLTAAHAHAQATRSAPLPLHDIPLLDGAIAIDGQLDDAGWAQARSIDIAYEISPGDNLPAPVKTTVRIGHTADALYIAYRAEDPDPSAIRARLRDRDGAFNDDFVGMMLDTFDDQRRAYEFFVNPLGVQMDLIKEEATGNEDPSWDGLWTSAGRLTAGGYEVEIRIPFSTLRFRSDPGPKRWGITFFRNYPRNKRHQLNAVRVPRDSRCFLCTFDKYEGMAGVRQGRNLLVVPSLTVGRPEYRAANGQAWRSDGWQIEPGLDVAWAPSPDMTLNATINPDFSQVESDQAQLDLNNSFALFFPEKRPFFLEGADYFNTQFDVLYTRQIADPDFGLRATGRTGSGAYGAILARDATTTVLVPGVLGSGFRTLDQKANVGVVRYRHDFGKALSIGLIGTFRHGEDYANDVAGLDLRWKQGGHNLAMQALHSQSRYPVPIVNAYRAELGGDDTPAGNALRANYSWGNRNWSFNSGHWRVDPGFRADLGFMGQVGYDKSVIGGSRTWYRDGKAFNRINLYADWDITHRFDGQLLERELEGELNINGPKQSYLGLGAMKRVRFWQGAMFDEDNLHLEGNMFVLPSVKAGFWMDNGRHTDLLAARSGRRQVLGMWADASLGRSVNLYAEASRQHLQRDGGTAFDASVADLRLGWQIDPRQRLRLALQGSRVQRDPALYLQPLLRERTGLATQVVYSYKVNPRTAFYAGLSWGGFSDDRQPDFFDNSRSLFLKYSYAWQPQF